MATNAEALGAPTPLGSDLQAGVEAVSYFQDVTFTKYVRVVLPLDQFAFWVRADRLSASALFNASRFNAFDLNASPRVVTPAATIVAKGSLHFATNVNQAEDETIAIKSVVFTSEQEINDLNQVGLQVMFLAEFRGIRFAFSSRGSFYEQAALWHYRGDAVYSDMESQIIDDPATLDTRNVVVSNSLPLWLSLNGYVPSAPPYGFSNPVQLFPSFLVPANLPPPYGAVHVFPESTETFAAAPYLDSTYSHSQLCHERVRVTLYGLRNFNALDFVDCVNQFSVDYGSLGIMNMPVVRDEKRIQAELKTIAQKKSIEYEVSYLQSTVRSIARQLISSAFIDFELDAAA
jgi:hypothetical protein